MKKKLIPFWMLPASWGLKGKTRDKAEIEYNYNDQPELCETKLAELDLSGKDLQNELINIAYRYGSIDEETSVIDRIALMDDGEPKDRAQLAYDRRYKDLSDREYSKRLATINKEPWVDIVHFGIEGEDVKQGDFELDWNKHFIDKLEATGYIGKSEDEIIQQWFHEICKNVALDVYDGIGDFNDRIDEGAKLRNTKTKKTRVGKNLEAE